MLMEIFMKANLLVGNLLAKEKCNTATVIFMKASSRMGFLKEKGL